VVYVCRDKLYVKGVRPRPFTWGKGGELKRIKHKIRVFDPGHILGVRVGNLNECERKHMGELYSWEPFFVFIELGCLVKTSLAKTLLMEKRPG